MKRNAKGGESAQSIKLLMDVISELVWIKDFNGVYLQCNQHFYELLSVKDTEVIGKTDHDFFTPDVAELFSANDTVIFKQQKTSVNEVLTLPLTCGNQLILQINKTPIISPQDGTVKGLIGVALDITEQRAIENEAKLQDILFRNILNMQFQFIAVLSPEGDVIEINDLPLKVQGLIREDYIGKKFWDSPIWSNLPEWKGILQRRLVQASNQEEAVVTEDVFQVQDGTTHHAQASTLAMRDDKGKVIGFIIQATDKTQLLKTEQAIIETEKKYQTLFEQIPQGIVLHDSTGKIVGANPAAEKIIGYSLDHLTGDYTSPDNWKAIREDGSEFSSSEHPVMVALESGAVQKDIILGGYNVQKNDFSWLLLDAVPLFDTHSSEPSGVFSSFSDITERKQSEERLRLSGSVFENTQEGILITDINGCILEINPAFSVITGYSREEVIGCNPRILKSGKHDQQFYQSMWLSLQEEGNWSGEIWNKRKSGVLYPAWQNMFTVKGIHNDLTHFVAVFADISLLKKSQEKIDHLAYHDTLTDLPNRLLLKERLDQAIYHASRHKNHFAVIFLDLDNFKNINDSFGHPQGDLLLQTVAGYLLETVRQGDTVARIGGDEFVLILEEFSDINKVELIADKILLALQQPIELEARKLNITASLGICLFPQDGDTTDELLQNADAAMYRAKERGRNNFQFYSRDLTKNALMRVQLENDLRQAIELNQLLLHFQPQLDLQSSKLIGVEALVRWQHPSLGMIMPNQFIPIAEESGLIHVLGNWVLDSACKQAAKWMEQGIDFGVVAVNVSGLQLQRGNFVELVKEKLLECNLPASKLELEVTEGVILQHTDLSITQLKKLRDFGVVLAVDDFGTGYSSLSYLKNLPIHKLKIDQSFIRDIARDTDDRAICRTIVALGDSLGLRVIAEGVENDLQAKYLMRDGCHEVQGFLYNKPVSGDEFEAFYYSIQPQD